MSRILLCFILMVLAGCGNSQSEIGQTVAKVGDYVISKEEFEEAFKDSNYATKDTLESRQVFLNNMINQKLILMDAQKRGLDKKNEFLKKVEHFWQQSLLTSAMQEESQKGGNLDEWVDYLRKNSKVEINQESLK